MSRKTFPFNPQTLCQGKSATGRSYSAHPQPHQLPRGQQAQVLVFDELHQKGFGHLFRDGVLVGTEASNWGAPSLLSFSDALPGDLLLILPTTEPPRLYRGKGQAHKPRSWKRITDPERIKQAQLLLLLQP